MDKILVHEDIQKASYDAFLLEFWLRKWPLSIFPKTAKSKVSAEINHGRWLVNCPNKCGEATVISETSLFFICVNCGSPENNTQFYRVIFPKDKAKIEILLLKRPIENRNWLIKESIMDLEAENKMYLKEKA